MPSILGSIRHTCLLVTVVVMVITIPPTTWADEPEAVASASASAAASAAQSDNATDQQARSSKNTVFDGVISFHGRQVRTNDPKEFKRLQRQMKKTLGRLNGPKSSTALPKSTAKAESDAVDSESFEGVININGKETRVNSRAEYERLQKQLGFPALGIADLDALKQANAQQAQAFEGVLNINGREFRTNNPAEMRRLQRQFGIQLPPLKALDGVQAGQENFEGMINDNGQIQKFNDPAAFRKAQQQLFNAFKIN